MDRGDDQQTRSGAAREAMKMTPEELVTWALDVMFAG